MHPSVHRHHGLIFQGSCRSVRTHALEKVLVRHRGAQCTLDSALCTRKSSDKGSVRCFRVGYSF